MDYQEVTDFINKAKKFGSRLDLTRITKLCELLENPQEKCKFIHVAGTNGKGSVSVTLSNILMEAGFKTGLYTSPFLYEFNERIQIDGMPISDDDLRRMMEKVADATNKMIEMGEEHPTEFELITALAFLYFAEQKCDVVVLEVGLGGRLDATNIIENPLVSVITSVSFDHTEYLGETLSEITWNKCGIIKEGRPVVVYPYQKEAVYQEIKKTAEEKGCKLFIPEKEMLKTEKSDLSGNRFSYQGEEYETSLVGEFQIKNALVSIETAKILACLGYDIQTEHIKAGLKKAKWPARFEVLRKSPTVICDGSHNEDGMRAFVETARAALKGKKAICVFGMLKDKSYEACLKDLSEICDVVICTEVDNIRKETAENLAQAAKKHIKTVYEEADNEKAVALAKNLAKKEDAIVCLGSLYMMKNMKESIEKLF